MKRLEITFQNGAHLSYTLERSSYRNYPMRRRAREIYIYINDMVEEFGSEILGEKIAKEMAKELAAIGAKYCGYGHSLKIRER